VIKSMNFSRAGLAETLDAGRIFHSRSNESSARGYAVDCGAVTKAHRGTWDDLGNTRRPIECGRWESATGGNYPCGGTWRDCRRPRRGGGDGQGRVAGGPPFRRGTYTKFRLIPLRPRILGPGTQRRWPRRSFLSAPHRPIFRRCAWQAQGAGNLPPRWRALAGTAETLRCSMDGGDCCNGQGVFWRRPAAWGAGAAGTEPKTSGADIPADDRHRPEANQPRSGYEIKDGPAAWPRVIGQSHGVCENRVISQFSGPPHTQPPRAMVSRNNCGYVSNGGL